VNTITIEDAREIFLSMLIARGYDGSIRTMSTYLKGEVSNKQLPPDLALLQTWFSGLDNDSQQYVLKIIQKAIDSALFGCLVLLDGLTGGNPIQEKASDFALYLQVYKDDEFRATNESEYRIRVNSPEIPEFLHDLYRDMIEERHQ
jgi:hypothetical protein